MLSKRFELWALDLRIHWLKKVCFWSALNSGPSTQAIILFLVRYASQEDAMNVDDLKHFLEIEQGHSHVSRELCLEIMNECEPSTQLRKKEMLGLDFIWSNS